MRQFGSPTPGARRRPGAYAVVHDDARGIAVVRAPVGLHLPGGGIEDGEDEVEAVIREVSEETGLTVAVVDRLGTVMQAVGRLNKVAHYLTCRVLAEGGPHEPDHELSWMTWTDALGAVRLDADRWAIELWAERRGR